MQYWKKNYKNQKQQLEKTEYWIWSPVCTAPSGCSGVQPCDWTMAVICSGSLVLLLQLNWCQPNGKTKRQDVVQQESQAYFHASTGHGGRRPTRRWRRVQDHMKATRIMHIWHSFVSLITDCWMKVFTLAGSACRKWMDGHEAVSRHKLRFQNI